MKVTPHMHLLSRLSRVRKRIAAADLDALLISYLPNVRYLSSFDGSSANLIITKDQLYFITDFRYITVVESLFANTSDLNFTLVTVDLSYDETIGDTLLGLGVQRIGVEGAHFTIRQYSWLRDFLGGASKKPIPYAWFLPNGLLRVSDYVKTAMRLSACERRQRSFLRLR